MGMSVIGIGWLGGDEGDGETTIDPVGYMECLSMRKTTMTTQISPSGYVPTSVRRILIDVAGMTLSNVENDQQGKSDRVPRRMRGNVATTDRGGRTNCWGWGHRRIGHV